MTKYNIGLIGLGSMGKNHLRVLLNNKDVKSISVFDSNCSLEDLKSEPKIEKFNSLEGFLEKKHSGIIIATPTNTHKEIALQCLEAKVPLFIEKPVATNVSEARSIQKKAKSLNIAIHVGHIERFNPTVKVLKNELKLEETISITITRVGPFPPRISDVGILTDLAVHDIDLLRYICQSEIKEHKVFRSQNIHHHCEDNAILSFEMTNGVVASIITNWQTPFKKRKIEVATKSEYVEANLINQEVHVFSDFNGENQSHRRRNVYVPRLEPLVVQLDEWIKFLGGEKVSDLSVLEDSLQTLEVVGPYALARL